MGLKWGLGVKAVTGLLDSLTGRGLVFAFSIVMVGAIFCLAPASAAQRPLAAPGAIAAEPATPAVEGERVTNPPPADESQQPAGANAGAAVGPPRYVTYKTPYEYFLSWITIILGIGMALVLCAMHWRTGASAEFHRTFIILVVVFASLFLIVAGYSETQTAPVFGLLGTIVGYIFGQIGPSRQINRGADPETKG